MPSFDLWIYFYVRTPRRHHRTPQSRNLVPDHQSPGAGEGAGGRAGAPASPGQHQAPGQGGGDIGGRGRRRRSSSCPGEGDQKGGAPGLYRSHRARAGGEPRHRARAGEGPRQGCSIVETAKSAGSTPAAT
jgi:hypothetical protein